MLCIFLGINMIINVICIVFFVILIIFIILGAIYKKEEKSIEYIEATLKSILLGFIILSLLILINKISVFI